MPGPPRPSPVRQRLLELALRIPQRRAITSLSFELLMRLVRAPGADEALVAYPLDGRRVLIPASHELSRYRRYWGGYGENLGRVGRAVHAKYSDLTAVDVGANVGDSALLLRREAPVPVLCVEGDPGWARLLRHNLDGIPGVEIEEVFLGAEEREAEVIRHSEGGTTWLVSADGGERVRFTTLASLLEAHPRFEGTKLVKLDTDGYDCHILLAERDTLERLRPVLFFEYAPDLYRDPGLALEALAALRDAGYTNVLAYLNHGEYLAAAALDDERLIGDLHAFVTGHGSYGRPSLRYLDLCAFHAEDEDVLRDAREAELRLGPPRRAFGR